MQLVPLDVNNEAHLRFMFDVRTAPEVAKNLFGQPPDTFEQHCAWVTKQQGVRQIYMIVEHYHDMFTWDLIGYCHIYNITDTSIEVGWAIHPVFHHQHFGTQAVYQLIDICGTLYPKRDIELYVKADNVPAIIIYIKQGFIPFAISNEILHMKKIIK